MTKSPALPVYTKDFDTDERVMMMDLEEEGAYFRLLRVQWREGSIPSDLKSLAKLLRCHPKTASRVADKVLACFSPHPTLPGRLVNLKTERVREEQQAFLRGRSEAGKKGAKSRWGDGSAIGKAIAEPMREHRPAVAVAVAVAVPEETDSRKAVGDSAGKTVPPPNPLVNRPVLEARFYELARELGTLADLDPSEVAKKATTYKGGSYIRPEPMTDDRLAHSVASMERWARELRGQDEPDLPAARASPKAQQRVDTIKAGVMGGLTDDERGELEQRVHGAVRRLPGSRND